MPESKPKKLRAEVAARAAHGTRQAIPVITDVAPVPKRHLTLPDVVREVTHRGRFTVTQIAGAIGVSAGSVRFSEIATEVGKVPGYRPLR
jgi:hypothetical protein